MRECVFRWRGDQEETGLTLICRRAFNKQFVELGRKLRSHNTRILGKLF